MGVLLINKYKNGRVRLSKKYLKDGPLYASSYDIEIINSLCAACPKFEKTAN